MLREKRINIFENIFSAILGVLIALFISSPSSLFAQMQEISEGELSQISAQAGINVFIGDSGFTISADSYSISDTDHSPVNWIEFNNVTVDDGEGGPFSLDTPDNFLDINTLDIVSDLYDRTLIYLNLSYNVEPRTYTVGNLVFCEQDLGSITLSDLTRGASDTLLIGSHDDGTCGIDMEYATKIDIASLTYAFNDNTVNNSLQLNGIHLAGYAAGSPEDPTSWTFSGKYKFGNFEDNNPVTMDVASTDEGETGVYYNIPMEGCLRVEGVEFGENTFGPVAIDGIMVHHLGMEISAY